MFCICAHFLAMGLKGKRRRGKVVGDWGGGVGIISRARVFWLFWVLRFFCPSSSLFVGFCLGWVGFGAILCLILIVKKRVILHAKVSSLLVGWWAMDALLPYLFTDLFIHYYLDASMPCCFITLLASLSLGFSPETVKMISRYKETQS